ncbi:MAG: hypothetical protein JOZ03_04660 [Gammaproteobacteria bacterium]|nr:hypothetical protein [Gammaproteobacteria bacterium]
MAAGNPTYATNLARYCVRLDALLSRILGVRPGYRTPTHIYALAAEQLRAYLGSGSASVRTTAYDVIVVSNNDRAPGSDYWGPYFGYTAGMLALQKQLKGPDWYMEGLPLVFASTSFEHGRAKLGNIDVGYGEQLGQGGALIPLRIFLKQRKQEVVALRPPSMYEAEAWALAHEIFVEGWHRAEFTQYLDSMRQGTEETAAFKASFQISYEQLHKDFEYAIHQRPSVYTLAVPEDVAARDEPPQRMSEAEIKGRLARLSLWYEHGPDPLPLASEALQLDPRNETALRALAIARLTHGDFTEALATVDKLSALTHSPAGSADAGDVLLTLAGVVQRGTASLPVDAQTLRQRAKENYAKALTTDPENRQALGGLAILERTPGDAPR